MRSRGVDVVEEYVVAVALEVMADVRDERDDRDERDVWFVRFSVPISNPLTTHRTTPFWSNVTTYAVCRTCTTMSIKCARCLGCCTSSLNELLRDCISFW